MTSAYAENPSTHGFTPTLAAIGTRNAMSRLRYATSETMRNRSTTVITPIPSTSRYGLPASAWKAGPHVCMTQSLSPASANTEPSPSAMPMKRSDVQFTPDLNAGTSITFSTNMATSAARPTAMADT